MKKKTVIGIRQINKSWYAVKPNDKHVTPTEHFNSITSKPTLTRNASQGPVYDLNRYVWKL